MSRAKANGRSKGGGPFVQLFKFMLESQAWKSLSPADRAVYIELCALYNGANNGRLGLGARRAAELCNISKNTVSTCFRILEARGFIDCVTAGGFSRKSRHQTEWRLTQYRCDVTGQLPTKAFAKWRPEGCDSRSQLRDASVPNEGQSASKSPLTVPRLGPSAREAAA